MLHRKWVEMQHSLSKTFIFFPQYLDFLFNLYKLYLLQIDLNPLFTNNNLLSENQSSDFYIPGCGWTILNKSAKSSLFLLSYIVSFKC